MSISAKKIVTVYAEVCYNELNYRVFAPNGTVLKWHDDDGYHEDGYWTLMSESETEYDEIKQAGLSVLE